MLKNFTFLILLISFFVGLNLDVMSQNSEDITVEKVNLELDKLIFCPVSRNEFGRCDNKRKIQISVVSPKAEKEGLDYYYLADGGEVIGKGANVVWDFSNARVGNYKITVGVGKNSIITGNIVSKSFTFEACNTCDLGCSCPTISFSAPTAPAKHGDTLIFTARLIGGSQDRLNFNWAVSEGEIIQKIQTESESQILVKISPKPKPKQITATVEVGGLCADCPERTASATVQIKK